MADGRTVAVLGTGIMGGPMARNLARAGFSVRAWNRTREKAEALADAGVAVADRPAAAAAGADFVLTMLADGAAVEAVMTGPDGALAAMPGDAVWLQCATVGPDAAERLGALAAGRGVGYVDAPVLGTRKPAEDAALTVLASGPPDVEPRCRPVFEAVGSRVRWLGPAGAGSRLKLVMNGWVLAVVGATAEAVALAEGLGIEPREFLGTLEGTPLDCPYVHLKAGLMLDRSFPPAFPTAGARKDAALIVDAARACGVSADVAAAVLAKMARAVEQGHADLDMAAAYLVTAGGR